MAVRLTDAVVTGLTCAPGRKDTIVFDDKVTGFAVRVSERGRRTFLLQYKLGGRVRRLVLGAFEDGLKTAIARDLAEKARGRVADKADPAAERKAKEREALAAEVRRTDCVTVLKAYPAALAQRGKSAKYQNDEVTHVRLAIAIMGAERKPPAEISPADIDKMLAASSSGVARARFGALSRFLSWAVKRSGDRSALPATATFDRHEKPAPPAPRKRRWSSKDLGALWQACEALPVGTPRDLALFLLTTPCRRGEAAAMHLADIDLKNRVWTQPTSKNADRHHFPLNALAVEILSRRVAALGTSPAKTALLFPGPRKGKAYSGWSNLAEAVDRRLGELKTPVADWEWHDVRRTFDTTLADVGIDEGLLDQILNHRASKSRGGVKRHYQFAERWEEKVKALAAWEGIIGAALEDPAPQKRSASAKERGAGGRPKGSIRRVDMPTLRAMASNPDNHAAAARALVSNGRAVRGSEDVLARSLARLAKELETDKSSPAKRVAAIDAAAAARTRLTDAIEAALPDED